jgi:hypothetical protein
MLQTAPQQQVSHCTFSPFPLIIVRLNLLPNAISGTRYDKIIGKQFSISDTEYSVFHSLCNKVRYK